MEILSESKTVSACFKASDSFLESFLIRFADAHNFADRSHLSAELIFCALEFFKRPAGKLDNNIVAVRIIFIESTVFSAWDVFKSKTAGEHCRNKSYREARCF